MMEIFANLIPDKGFQKQLSQVETKQNKQKTLSYLKISK
jgi:hypothetical protein